MSTGMNKDATASIRIATTRDMATVKTTAPMIR